MGAQSKATNKTKFQTADVPTQTDFEDLIDSYADIDVVERLQAKGTDIASATTTDIGAATGDYVTVTGTTTITGLGTITAGRKRIVRFAGILTLTHNATSLILPTGADITTAANDVATFVSEGSGNWRCVEYMKADGSALLSNQIVGSFFNDIFDRPTIGSNYTAISTPTTSIVSDKLNVSNGASNYSKLLTIGNELLFENWYISIIINGVNTDGTGIALGHYDGSISQSVASFDMNTAGNRGQTIISSLNATTNTLTTRATSTANLSYTNSDRIKLEFRRMAFGTLITATNLTNTSITPITTYTETTTFTTGYIIARPYKPALYILGGDINIESLEIGSFETKNSKVCFTGDSNSQGFYASTPSQRFVSLLEYDLNVPVLNYSAGGARVSTLDNCKENIVKYTCEGAIVSIHIGTNDALNSVTAVSYQTSLNSLVAYLLENKRIPVICLPIPLASGSTNYTAQNTLLTSYATNINTDWSGKVLIVDTRTPLGGSTGTPTLYNSDQIHLNDEGHRVFANTVRSATTKVLSYKFSPYWVNPLRSSVLYDNQANSQTSFNLRNSFVGNASSAMIGAFSDVVSGRTIAYSSSHATLANRIQYASVGGDAWYVTSGANSHNWAVSNATTAIMTLSTGSSLGLTAATNAQVGYSITNTTNGTSSRGVFQSTIGISVGGLYHYSAANTTTGLASSFLFYNNNGDNVYASNTGTHKFLIGGIDPTGSQKKLELTGTSLILSTSVDLIGAATQNVFNTTSTTVNAFGAATSLTLGGTSTAAVTYNLGNNATATATTKTINIGTGGASGSISNVNLGSATAGATSLITVNGGLKLPSYTVATLPTVAAGVMVYVTDALAPTYNTTVVGGGAEVIPVIYNGTTWTCH